MKQILIFVLCFGLCLGLIGSQEALAKGKSGIETVDMKAYNDLLAKHRGKVVVVNFFATWCPPCREEIPGLVSIADGMSKDVVIIGLSGDEDLRKLPPFIKSMQIKYPVYSAEMEIFREFRVSTIPHNLVYDQNGKIVANASGFVTEEELKKFINMLLEENANAKRNNS